jgi:hypothetical protein
MQIDVRLDEVVLRALEKEPQRRYQQASEVKTDIEIIAGSSGQRPGVIAPAAVEAKTKAELSSAIAQVRWPAIGLVAAGILNWVSVLTPRDRLTFLALVWRKLVSSASYWRLLFCAVS